MSDFKETQHGRNHRPGGSDPIPGWSGFIRYDFDNIGDWLSIETTDNSGPASVYFGQVSQLHKAYNPSGTNKIIFSAGTDPDDPTTIGEVGLFDNQWVGYIPGGELVYTLGGDILRYTGGGDFLVYTTDGSLPGAFGNVLFSPDKGNFGVQPADAGNGTVEFDVYPDFSGLAAVFVGLQDSGTAFVVSGSQPTDAAPFFRVNGDYSIVMNASLDVHVGGSSVTIWDSGASQIFRVDDDGTVHIKTGTAVIADL